MDEMMDSQASTIKFDQYLRLLLQYKWLIAACAIAGLFIGIVLAQVLPKVYRSYSLIMVEGGKILNPLMSNVAVSVDPSIRLREIQQEILSWPRLAKLVEKLQLDKDLQGEAAYWNLIEHLKKKIVVEFKDKAQTIISIIYEGQDPQRVQDIVASMTDIIVQKNVAGQAEDAEGAISFIGDQLDYYREKLESSEKELAAFSDVYKVQLPVMTQLNDQLIDLQVELRSLLIENTEEHPSVVAVKKRIAQIEGEMQRQTQTLVSKGINVNDKKYLDIAKSVPRQEQEYARLVRDRKVNEKMYETLLEKYESAKISQQLDGTDQASRFKIIEPARKPITPIKPDKNRVILICFALGFGISVGLIFLREMMNPAFKSIDEVKRILGDACPVLGTISVINCGDDDEEDDLGVVVKQA